MAVVQPDFYSHENYIRRSIQIPSTQHKELKALAVELESSLGDVVETIMELMQQDNYQQVKAAIIQNYRGNASPSYPLTIVASMSRTEREIPLHVRIAPSEENGLSDYTDVKCEQIMTIEKTRLLRRRGNITSEELGKVDVALKLS